MVQKTIWMPYLIIGISVLIGFNSCFERVDSVKTVNYIYKNHTGIDLVMEVYNSNNVMFKSFSILNGDEVETNTTKFEVPAVFYFEGINGIGDSVVVRFDDNKCLYLSKSVSSKIFKIKEYDNYSEKLIEESKYTLYFTFTEQDYNASVECD